MKKWVKILVLTTVLIGILISLGRVIWDNYKHYYRATKLIEALPVDQVRDNARTDFYGTDPDKVYGGIYAGSIMDRVWVWGKGGLRSFVVDNNSVYSWFDGCNDSVLAKLNAGVSGAINGDITTIFEDWKMKVSVGDYVKVYIAQENMGGKKGSLREIYAYNFWLFLPVGMEERCAK